MSMSGRPSRLDRIRPWAALLLPALAWMVYEYGAGSALRPACEAVGRWLGPAWGVASLVLCALGAAIAWPLARQGDAVNPPTRPWLARLALLAAGIFALAIAFQLLATFIVPACAR